ncbi:MAG: sulfotransferase family 2 domain-containing protein [Lamprobacter sp.]|uniref:sulfotransferase family 2 domain-containing protein n=1 Tax=Lamprobacter sp. TaxID=3100796 RepID=UPI002B262739|nr:sulfotransferase family 2 domain-containing protein [Lamprobacter sp.]MEA3638335.1 sulfotransferase family 2 domain-containing protein [Lamprobacter sp.]
MIINHSLKFIFLHVPKTAGTSVTSWLSEHTGWNDIELGGTHYGEQIQAIYGQRFKLHKHSPANQVKSIVGSDIWNSYYKFAIVRHPLDRLVSAFHFYQAWEHPSVAPAKECKNINEFLNSAYFDKDRRNCTRSTGSQAKFLESPQNEPLDKICRFEMLEDDIAEVADFLRINLPQLPHKNKTAHDTFQAYFTPEMRALAEGIYFSDFLAFGYQLSA